MKIDVYTLCYNEEVILPFFIDHYKKFCNEITIWDNMSTDNSVKIAKDNGCKVIQWNSNDTIDDMSYMQIKHNAYKESRGKADWVIVCDTDELYYHYNIIDLLKEYDSKGINLPKVEGYDMVSDRLPKLGTPITEQIKYGVRSPHLDKRCIFKPELDMRWTFGCHPGDGRILEDIKNRKESLVADIKLLHYKILSNQYVKDKYRVYAKRLSQFNKSFNLGSHYLQEEAELDRQFNDYYMLNRTRIL